MTILTTIILGFLTSLFSSFAEEPEASATNPSRAEIIKRFDKDGDGKLSAEEGAAARRVLATQRTGEAASKDKPREYRAINSVLDPKAFKVEGGNELFSGPQPGEKLPKLQVAEFNGEAASKTIDALGQNKGAQLLILSDQTGSSARGIIGLLRVVDTINKKSDEKLNAIVVYLGDDKSALVASARRYSQHVTGNPTVGISNDGRDGPGRYGLNRNVSMTIILAKDGKVRYNFPFPQGMLTPDPHVLGAISEVVNTKPGDLSSWLAAATRERAAAANRNGGTVNVRALLTPIMNKDSSDVEIDGAARRLDALLKNNNAAAIQVGAAAKRMVESGNLENYGTERAQYHLFKWAKLYGDAKPEYVPPAKKK